MPVVGEDRVRIVGSVDGGGDEGGWSMMKSLS